MNKLTDTFSQNRNPQNYAGMRLCGEVIGHEAIGGINVEEDLIQKTADEVIENILRSLPEEAQTYNVLMRILAEAEYKSGNVKVSVQKNDM